MAIRFLLVLSLGLVFTPPATGQPRLAPFRANDQVLYTDRPRVAVAPDGSFAFAWEAYRESPTVSQLQIVVQRFAPDGRPVGPSYYFGGESCSSLDLWTSDYMHHAEIAFEADGYLAVLMAHSGTFSLGSVSDVQTTEATVAAIDPNGQIVDLNNSSSCVQRKLYFRGSGRQQRGRLAFTPRGDLLVSVDGYFDGDHGEATYANVAVRIDDANGQEVASQWIPHADPGSRNSLHSFPDVAAGADRMAVAWHACPVDAQGNVLECDVALQFVSTAAGQFQTLGGNVPASAGAPAGTYSVWPSMDMNAAGSSVVVWVDTRTRLGGEVFGQRFDANGQPVGANFQVSTGQGDIQERPEVAMLADGRFMAVWTDSSAAGFRARGRQFDAAGNPLAGAFELAGATSMESGRPAVAAYGAGYLYTWLAAARGRPAAVYTSNMGLLVGTEEAGLPAPSAFELSEAYPNPFGGRATLTYRLAETGAASLIVYDMLGREVARLVDALQPPGRYEATLDAAALPAGVYVARLRQGASMHTRLLVHK